MPYFNYLQLKTNVQLIPHIVEFFPLDLYRKAVIFNYL